MADRSLRVVYAALIGNMLVAVTKYGAAAVSGSSSMLTEAVHSTTDTINQLLLLFGNRRSRAPPDRSHDFGYGMEIYYWTFVVAMMVLVAGGVVSVYTGWSHLVDREPIAKPLVSFAVLALSAVFEGASFAIGYREYKRVAASHVIPGWDVSVWTFIKLSKDPNLYESLLEDGAALIGIAIAAAGIAGSAIFGLLWADGAASIAIGAMLIANSFVILGATQSLMGGEAVAPPLRRDIDRAIGECCGDIEVSGVKTLHLGPRTIMVVLSIADAGPATSQVVRDQLWRLRKQLKRVDGRIRYVMVEID